MRIEAASAGAYHKRDRFWFVADRNDEQRRLEQRFRGGAPEGHGINLIGAARAALWGTARVTTNGGRGTPGAKEKSRLEDQVQATQASSGSSEPGGKRAALNPEFVCWLMGYRAEWLFAAPRVLDWLPVIRVADYCVAERTALSALPIDWRKPQSPPVHFFAKSVGILLH
jgi:hypothetical protein